MLATALLATATVAGFALLYTRVFPRISLLECVGGAAPLGLTLSAWAALLLKSTLFQRQGCHEGVWSMHSSLSQSPHTTHRSSPPHPIPLKHHPHGV